MLRISGNTNTYASDAKTANGRLIRSVLYNPKKINETYG
jgi:hypothetical protein